MGSVTPQEFEGKEAYDFAQQHLEKLSVDSTSWEIEYRDSLSGEKWIMDYPHSEYHGGGSPRLRKVPLSRIDGKLHTELWISWASLLRSYAAAHGLNSNNFAVIEFGEDEIILRFGSKWTRFTHDQQQSGDGNASSFGLNEDGTVTLDGKIDEMDFAAERITRELMQ
jgi:hypothetical protein